MLQFCQSWLLVLRYGIIYQPTMSVFAVIGIRKEAIQYIHINMEWNSFFAKLFIDIAIQKISTINAHKPFVKWQLLNA